MDATHVEDDSDRVERDREADLKIRSKAVAIRMVRSGLVAVSRFDGDEFCWFDLVKAYRSGDGIVLKKGRVVDREDYDVVSHACGAGLLGTLPIDGKEVFLPTPAAWEAAGIEFDPSRPSAPDDWRRIHGDWRRAGWTSIARKQDVRIYPVDRDPDYEFLKGSERVKEERFYQDHFGYLRGDVRIEGGPACNNIAGWRPGHKVRFWNEYSCSLDPFTCGDYADVDALLSDLHGDGRFVTDLRRVVETITDPSEVSNRLRAGMLVERVDYGTWILLAPRTDGRHEDLRRVPRDVATKMIDQRILVDIGCVTFRHGNGNHVYTLPELASSTTGIRRPSYSPEPDLSPVLAVDDDGRPITEKDVYVESYRQPLDGASLCVLPSFDYPGTEEQWETEQLVEAVRARRRQARDQAATADFDFSDWSTEHVPFPDEDRHTPIVDSSDRDVPPHVLPDLKTLPIDGIGTPGELVRAIFAALFPNGPPDLPGKVRFSIDHDVHSWRGVPRTSIQFHSEFIEGMGRPSAVWFTKDIPQVVGDAMRDWWSRVVPEGCSLSSIEVFGSVTDLDDVSPDAISEDIVDRLRGMIGTAATEADAAGSYLLFLEYGRDRFPRTFRACHSTRGHKVRFPVPGLQRALKDSLGWLGAIGSIQLSVTLPSGRQYVPPESRHRTRKDDGAAVQ